MRSNIEYEVALLKEENLKEQELKAQKKKKILIVLMLVAIIIVLSAIIFSLQAKRINELETEVERLSDPIAIYEEASKEVDIRLINARYW